MSVGTQPAAEPLNVTKLSDKELIQRYCKNKGNNTLADELWRRHQMAIYEELQKCSRSLCPAFCDQRDLVHDSFLQARKNLRARICKFRELDSARSLRAWLGQVARSTMLDERRETTGSRRKKKIVEVSIEKPAGEEYDEATHPEITEETLLELPEVVPEPGPKVAGGTDIQHTESVAFNEPLRSDYLYFRSRYSTSPLDPVGPIEWEQLETERRVIFRDVLTRHAQRSDEDGMCASMIRLRYWRKWPVAKVVERFYGPPETERQRQARHRAYFRLLDKNYLEILAELRRAYGVVKPEQI
jgi:hypothetical protein